MNLLPCSSAPLPTVFLRQRPPFYFRLFNGKRRARPGVWGPPSRIPEISRNQNSRRRGNETDQALGDRSCTFRENIGFGTREASREERPRATRDDNFGLAESVRRNPGAPTGRASFLELSNFAFFPFLKALPRGNRPHCSHFSPPNGGEEKDGGRANDPDRRSGVRPVATTHGTGRLGPLGQSIERLVGQLVAEVFRFSGRGRFLFRHRNPPCSSMSVSRQ